MKGALWRALGEFNIDQVALGKVLGINQTAMSRAIGWELEISSISRVAAALGYVAHGPVGQPVFRLRPLFLSRKFETVPRDEVVRMLRDAVRKVGTTGYALRYGGISACTTGLRPALRGECEIPERYLSPLKVMRRDGEFVREVTS
jgi:hypothetical protein